jgi:dimethylaniline monooxygenase (N-oxide forming)
MSEAPRVCVIGAGMSGLAALDALTRAGYEVTCYEAGSDVGGMWRYENDSGRSAAYASLETNTSRRRMEYPSYPMPDSAPEFLHHSDMLRYLESYASANGLARHISFGAPVHSARLAGPSWEVLAGDRDAQSFDWLVVASGHYHEPAIPDLPGHFEGMVMHARDYRTPDAFAGRRVVVAGGAQSALDIAAEISTVASATTLACDQVHHLLPRHVFGRPVDGLDSPMAPRMPLPAVRVGLRALLLLAGARPDRGNLRPPRHRLFETRWPIVVSPAARAALAAGAFASRPRVSALAGEQVAFSDGGKEPADAIVFATGYRISFPFLSERLGRGSGWEFPLYRRILSPHAPGLAFIGVLEPGPGLFEIVERQSLWLAEVIAGRVPVPGEREMWSAIDAGERRSRRQFAATGRHTILCNRHAYLEVLARDLRTRAGVRRSARPRAGRRLPAAVPGARMQAQLLRSTASEVAGAPADGTLEQLARHRYALVVTFRRDGTPVATPVWAACADGRAYVRAERHSGKVKRLRHDSRALLAPCTTSGRPLGAPLQAEGRVLAADEERIAERALAARYGLGRATFERTMDLMRVDMCYLEFVPGPGVELEPDAGAPSHAGGVERP